MNQMNNLTRVVAAALTVAACASDAPHQSTEPASIPIAAPQTQVSASRAVMGDVSSRIIGGSDLLAANAELVDAINAVNDAIDRGSASALESALTRADRAVTRLASTEQTEAPELDAIRFALADARRLLPDRE